MIVGLTGRKLIVDSFGDMHQLVVELKVQKDYTKVDRSGLYAASWIAKHIVASGLAKKAIVQISYAIELQNQLQFQLILWEHLQNLMMINYQQFVMDTFPLTPRWITKKICFRYAKQRTFFMQM